MTGGAATTSKLADGDYIFRIYSDAELKTPAKYSDGTEIGDVTITIENGASNTKTIENLLVGKYYVHEVEGLNETLLVGDNNDQLIDITKTNYGTVQTAEFTNNRPLGKLTIKKNVTVDGTTTTSKLARVRCWLIVNSLPPNPTCPSSSLPPWRHVPSRFSIATITP